MPGEKMFVVDEIMKEQGIGLELRWDKNTISKGAQNERI